ncbi:MAG: OapB/ArvB family protein [Thermoplasmatota archaeon]
MSRNNKRQTQTAQQEMVFPHIHLISAEKMDAMETMERIRFILDEVEEGKILVLERGLDPQEEAKLIEQTMMEIDQDKFIGIEMQSYGMDHGKNMFQRVVMGGPRPRMAVIGPANLLRMVSKDNEQIVTRIVGKDKGD